MQGVCGPPGGKQGGGKGGRGLCGGLCCVGACVCLQRRACVVCCRPGGLEEKLAVFCGCGKDLADERAYLVHPLVAGGKRVCYLWARAYAAEDPVDGVVPGGEGVLTPGGLSFRVSGPASICVWAVGMSQIQGTLPVDGQQRLINWVRQSMASPRW